MCDSHLGFLHHVASSCIYHMFVRTLTSYVMMKVSLFHSRGAVIDFIPPLASNAPLEGE